MSAKQTLASINALIQGLNSKLDALSTKIDTIANDQASNFVTLVRRITGVEALVKQVKEMQQQHTQLLNEHTQLLNHLIKEVGALKHTDGKLMVTCFAFAAQEDLAFSQGDLAVNSRIAQRYCNKHRIRYSQVSDPRFGYVNVYPREVLEQLFLQEDSSEYLGWKTLDRTEARY